MKDTGRKKAALALAVSLWMAEGAFWAPGVASAEVTITSTNTSEDPTSAVAQWDNGNGTLGKKDASPLPCDSYFLNTGTKMNIAGGDCKDTNFFAGYSDSDEMSGYTLTVDSGTFSDKGELAGGYSFNGTANNNNVYIKGGEGGASVFGGRGQKGASGNTVDMTGGKFSLVRGAYTHDGDATGNTVTIKGGTVDRVFGGESHAGSATGNSVTVSGGTIGKGVFGDGVYGGRVYGTINSAGVAKENTVTVSGGTINGSVYGGGAGSETESKVAATGNIVKITETDTAAPTTIEKEVYGGYSQYNAADKNVVTISGGAIGGTDDTNNVYGGYGYTGTSENKVTISGGTMSDQVYGGFSAKGAADKNTVTISGGAIGTDDTNNIYGGYGYTGTSENKVTISGGTMSGQVYGGYTGAKGAANKNVLEISGGTVESSVTGGYVDSPDAAATAEGNKVTISNGTINGDVNGGFAGSATGNMVTIAGGTVNGSVYGGMGSTEATGNTVTFTGGTVNGNIIGGWSEQGNASDNIITISGDAKLAETVMIYGGLSTNGGNATGNTVNILTAINVAHLMGGDGATSTGNTLNLAVKGVKVGAEGVAGFQNLNFYLPSNIAKGDTMLDVTGTADVKGATFAVAAQTGVTLSKNDTVTLLKAGTLNTDETLKTTQTTTNVPTGITTSADYEFEISKDGKTAIVAKVTKVKGNPNPDPDPDPDPQPDRLKQAKSLVETRAATTTFLNAGADMLASQGFAQAANAVALETAESAKNGGEGAPAVSGFTPFAAFGGSGMRAESGSYVDTRGFGLNIGFAREIPNAQGKLLFGPVVEYGGGSYDSYLEDANNTHGEGGSHYWGVGVMARQTNRSGFYYEGSVRGGRVTSDYKGNVNNLDVNYDSASNYWAAHIGVGKAAAIGGGNTLDAYLKYFYSHQSGDTVTMHVAGLPDEKADFGSVDSSRIRLGARLTHKINDRNNFYAGLAYQYEFDGSARATFNGGSPSSPSVKGGSGMLELGWQVKPGEGPLTLDLGVTGWAGKQRGGSVQLGVTWTF